MQHKPLSLDPADLPGYAVRTALRMLIAMGVSLVFTFTYATLGGQEPAGRAVLVPLLDILQSVPILGFSPSPWCSSGAVARPRAGRGAGRDLRDLHRPGLEHGLQLLPIAAHRAGRSRRGEPQRSGLIAWQRFWRIEVPFAMPGLIWNMMMSMSGGWFFVVASEAISVGDINITLPGVGSYVARAIESAIWRRSAGRSSP